MHPNAMTLEARRSLELIISLIAGYEPRRPASPAPARAVPGAAKRNRQLRNATRSI
ncbi:MAG: hypothetical protein AB1916_15550 [Thermodesulfobacteriota bacterium]